MCVFDIGRTAPYFCFFYGEKKHLKWPWWWSKKKKRCHHNHNCCLFVWNLKFSISKSPSSSLKKKLITTNVLITDSEWWIHLNQIIIIVNIFSSINMFFFVSDKNQKKWKCGKNKNGINQTNWFFVMQSIYTLFVQLNYLNRFLKFFSLLIIW